MEGVNSKSLLTCGTVLVYLTLNTSLNMFNKWALGVYGFRFPIFITICHMAFAFVALFPFMFMKGFRERHRETLAVQWKGLVGIGVFLAANISLNNISLVHITLSLNQVIRAAIPVVTCILAVFVESRIPSGTEFGSLCVLSLGVMIGVWEGSAAGDVEGIMFALVAMVSNAAMMTFSGKVLSERLDAVRLSFYTAPVCCVTLLPFFMARELPHLSAYWQEHSVEVTWILLGGSIVALSYNIVHSLIIQLTSAVTTTVLGMVKIVGIFILSAMFLGESSIFTLKMFTGVMLTLIGFAMYSYARLQVLAAKTAILPVAKKVDDKQQLLKSSSTSSIGSNPGKVVP